uniref:FHA domain-containing protein n=1 Tax=Cacopsylla melanoneura TaxID=428564 RepID=A0A8D9EIQ6_9HEMI
MEFMDDFSDYIGTQQLNHDTTETSATLQKTLYLFVNNDKKLLKLGENTVGRAEDADVRFNLDTVSYNHAIIECEPNDFFIKDLRSTNFTKRDGKVMKPYVVYELKSGTKLMFGNVEATFYAIDDESTTDQEQVTLPLLVEEDITDQSSLNQSVSLLDTSGPEVPEEIIPPSIKPKASIPLAPPDSASKWDKLKQSTLSFTEEDTTKEEAHKSESSTDSEFEFVRNPARSPNKDQSNVNAKTRDLNECVEGTEDSDSEANKSIHDLETQKPPTNRGKRKKDIHDLETQYSPKPQDEDDDNIHGLETQCSPPQRPQRPKRKNIHDLDTQMSPPAQRSTRRNIHDLETQRSPNSNKKGIYDLETQIPSDTKNSEEQPGQSKGWDSEMYNLETQKPFSNNVESDTDDDDDEAVVGENIQNEMINMETQGKTLEDKNNAKKKARKKTKKTKADTTGSSSSDEEESNTRNTRLKTKRKKPPTRTKKAVAKESPKKVSEDSKNKKAVAKETVSPKKVSEDSSTDFEDMENNLKENIEEPKKNQISKEAEDKIEEKEVNDENEKNLEEDSIVENSVNENMMPSHLNDTNSESFIGRIVTGKKKQFILSSSSETDIESDAGAAQIKNLENEPEVKKSGQSSQNNKTKSKPSDQSNKDSNETSHAKNKDKKERKLIEKITF